MRQKLTFLFILALFTGLYASAQAPEQDCINAIPVCQPFYQQTNSYVGTGTYPMELTADNQGCLGSGEKNDVWYIINVTTSGTLEFTITPVNLANDYDFAVWDITGVGCDAIFNYSTNTAEALLPIGCNYSGTPGATGLSNSITGSQWSVGLNVSAGQTLVLNVSNFSSTAAGYSLDFGPSTASIYDNVPPKVTGVFTHCQYPSDALTIKTSEPVRCNSITAAATEWTITPAGGGIPVAVSATGLNCGTSVYSATTTITLNLSSVLPPGAYNLNLANGTDGNTLLDNCGNAALAAAIPFVIVSPDPPKMISVDTPACNHARIHLDAFVKCSTIAADGSDFTVTGPSVVNVIKAIPYNCNTAGLTDTVDIFFSKSIYTAGTYTVGVKVGSDLDAVTDTCGGIVNSTIDFVISDQGMVTGIASPMVLCEPGYTNLASSVTTIAAPVTVNCGVNGTLCNGTPTTYAIGDPAATGTTVNSPFYATTPDARTQMIFRADELRAAGMTAGTINQLAMNVTSTPGNYYVNFTIKMSCTTLSTLKDYVPSLPIVYQSGGYLASVGSNTFDLDNTYDWDGVSNIIVEMCYHNAGGNLSNDAVQTTTGLFPGAVLHNHAFGSNGCAMTKAGAVASADRPNITFSECTPPRVPFTYLWSPAAFLNDSAAANTFGFVRGTTTYQIEIMDSNACYRRDTVGVIVSVRTPGVSADTAICLGEKIQLNATGGFSYLWSPSTGLSCDNCPSPFASPTQTTLYSAYIMDELGCFDTLTTNLIVHPLPILKVNTHDTAIVYGMPVQLFATGGESIHYLWTPASGLNDNLRPNPIANPTVTTDYVVMVTDIHKCRSYDTILVRVRTDVPILIPSAFTPNGDGVNDVFKIVNLTFHRVMEFRVFNRWGQEVFSTQDSHTGWDGTFNGVKADAGVYQYLIRVATPDGQTQTFKGDVTLVQ